MLINRYHKTHLSPFFLTNFMITVLLFNLNLRYPYLCEEDVLALSSWRNE